jgi:hypothetical protein
MNFTKYYLNNLIIQEGDSKMLSPEKQKRKLVKKKWTLKTVVLALGLSFVISGCGTGGSQGTKSPIQTLINNVTLKTYQLDADQWVAVNINLATGGFVLTGASVPVVDPSNHSRTYGQLAILPSLCSGLPGCTNGGDVQISLNITQTAQVNGLNPTLPNGAPLPIGGLMNSTVIALPVGDDQINARIYFAFGPGIAMIGTALSFAAMDAAGDYVPNISLFQPIQIGPVALIAGLYTGSNTLSSGVGVFMDLSSVMNQRPNGLTPLVASLDMASQRKGLSAVSNNGYFFSRLALTEVNPSPLEKQKLMTKLNILSKQKHKLSLK